MLFLLVLLVMAMVKAMNDWLNLIFWLLILQHCHTQQQQQTEHQPGEPHVEEVDSSDSQQSDEEEQIDDPYLPHVPPLPPEDPPPFLPIVVFDDEAVFHVLPLNEVPVINLDTSDEEEDVNEGDAEEQHQENQDDAFPDLPDEPVPPAGQVDVVDTDDEFFNEDPFDVPDKIVYDPTDVDYNPEDEADGSDLDQVEPESDDEVNYYNLRSGMVIHHH